MRLITKLTYCFILLGISACNPLLLIGVEGYENLGSFNSKIEAQNKALSDILSRYDVLPKKKFYKSSYSFTDSLTSKKNAIWYNRDEQLLGYETKLYSGQLCMWYEVNKITLEQIVKANRGMIGVDSLARSEYNNSICL